MKKRFEDNCELIWYDRKRYFGLPWSFTHYYLVKHPDSGLKLHISIGLLSRHDEEVMLYRVDDFSVYRSFFDLMFNVGTVEVWCRDASDKSMLLKSIKYPYKVKNMLSDYVLKERENKNMRFSEFQV